MSPKLKPLILPQLVEERRKLEVQKGNDGFNTSHLVYPTSSSSSSDVASPVTPTFPRGHLRYSSSTSSLEMTLPASVYNDLPASPTQPSHSKTAANKRLLPDVQEEPLERDEDDTVVSLHLGLYDSLLDEPYIHRDSDMIQSTTFSHSKYDIDYDVGFLSDGDFSTSPRSMKKRRGGSESSFSGFGLASRFGSRFPAFGTWKASSKRSNTAQSPVRDAATGHDRPHSVSRAASSRSSSLSGQGRVGVLDRASGHEPPLPPTPALSFYESCESVLLPPQSIDVERANSSSNNISDETRASLERDRAMATTPLLPPLMTEAPTQQPPRSAAGSMHQSPPMRPTSTEQAPILPAPQPRPHSASQHHHPYHHHPTPSHVPLPSPPLSTKPSVSSFRPATAGCATTTTSATFFSSALPPTSDIPPLALLSEAPAPGDAWSDRLGHANFTILPAPYSPSAHDLSALRDLRAAWDAARVAYARHLARTGEHYGATSRTYALTEDKWAEVEAAWRAAHDACVDAVVARGAEDAVGGQAGGAGLTWRRLEDGAVVVGGAAVPPRGLGLLGSLEGGKFPERGDEDIVGPMARDEVMAGAVGQVPSSSGMARLTRARSEERGRAMRRARHAAQMDAAAAAHHENHHGGFWRNLVERVGRRR